MTLEKAAPLPLRSDALAAAEPAILHGFFTRQGGVSEGIYAGLNVGLGSADARRHVEENRRLAAAYFAAPADRLATVNQVHSPRVHVVGDDFDGARPEADALVTMAPGLVLGVLAADCGPVLFADPAHRVIGAAHAGWKGTLAGVLENTIEAMVAHGAVRADIVAVLGPSISAENYEVGPEFVERFMQADPAHAAYFKPSLRKEHALFDLKGLTLARLAKAGVQGTSLGLCTYADPERFYSYRRMTHRGEPDYGRQLSAIALRKD